MTHTLAAVFEERADADRAREDLVKAGFGPDTIELNDASSAAASAVSHSDEDGSILGGIQHIFRQLLGREHEDRHVYAEAVHRGHAVLTLTALDRDQADRAADIIEAHGPLDIDEHADQWRAGGWSGAAAMHSGAGAAQSGAAGAQQSAPRQDMQQGTQQGTQQGMQQGMQQSAQPVQSDLSRSQQDASASSTMQHGGAGAQSFANDPLAQGQRTGQQRGRSRIYPMDDEPAYNQDIMHILRGDEISDTEVTYFRSHWQDTFAYAGGTYQEYDPAYRYGVTMAGSSAYHGLPWEHAEAELRGTWERTYPQSSWEKFKDAVREGWDRVTK